MYTPKNEILGEYGEESMHAKRQTIMILTLATTDRPAFVRTTRSLLKKTHDATCITMV